MCSQLFRKPLTQLACIAGGGTRPVNTSASFEIFRCMLHKEVSQVFLTLFAHFMLVKRWSLSLGSPAPKFSFLFCMVAAFCHALMACVLNVLWRDLKFIFFWESNTRTCVLSRILNRSVHECSSHFQTPRTEVETRGAAEKFEVLRLEMMQVLVRHALWFYKCVWEVTDIRYSFSYILHKSGPSLLLVANLVWSMRFLLQYAQDAFLFPPSFDENNRKTNRKPRTKFR